VEQFFKISDFSKQIGKHQNTVDNWFKLLEEKKLHYINRIDNEKVYDEQDLFIAKHISEKRNSKWALEAICNELPELFELRPFPLEMEPTTTLQTFDIESLKQKFSEEIKVTLEQLAAAQMSELKKQHEELIKQLPKSRDLHEERQERVNDLIVRRRVERELEQEALHLWSTKPENEKLRRIGIFRKEEDRDKRHHFVKDYIDEHYESRLREKFGVN
jgi:hypothetical protein